MGENDFVIRAVINEMKGRNMEHLGKTYDLLSVKGGDVGWAGLPLEWV